MLGRRLMVGPWPLTPVVEVRILSAQPELMLEIDFFHSEPIQVPLKPDIAGPQTKIKHRRLFSVD